MTKLLKGAYGVGVAAVLVVSAGAAQAADLKARIPFAFTVHGRTLPAGAYDVSMSQSVVTVRGLKDGAFVLGNRVESATDRTSKLVFHRYGDVYVLYQAWSGGVGREMPKPREIPRRGELAARVERVEVPLL